MRNAPLVTCLCLVFATAAWAQPRPAGALQPPPAATSGSNGEKAPSGENQEGRAKDEKGGFWSWLGGNSKDAPELADIPDRPERPLRVERPERASGGCCQ
jgi:hypothetical protein